MCFSRARLLLVMIGGLGACGSSPDAPSAAALALQPWDQVLEQARGGRVVWRMWRGDPSINSYVDHWVVPQVREQFGITLTAVEGQGATLVNQLVVERETGASGSADLVWINGETFSQLRAEALLQGPWAGSLPNARYVDSASSIISRDFDQDPAGFESPWGTVQFALIYDTVRTPHPPRSVAELGQWILEHPGRFTHDQAFTGATFLKILMYALGGGVEHFQGGFHADRYAAASAQVFEWLEARRASFWRQGRAWPGNVADLHRLFANAEVDFSMSNNENEVQAKVRQGLLPASTRPLLLRDGTIANAHYLGIPFNAPNPAAAMVVADFLLSPGAQFEKQRGEVWGDGTVLQMDRLPEEWRAKFASLDRSPQSLSRDSLRRYARPEVAPGYHERLIAEWRERIRERTP